MAQGHCSAGTDKWGWGEGSTEDMGPAVGADETYGRGHDTV